MYLQKTIEKNDFTAKIYYDENSESPREWDNLGTFCTFKKSGWIIEKQDIVSTDDFSSWDAMREYLEKEHIVLPVYMYSHSGDTVATTPFSCSWDSGQIGFIVVSKEKVRKEYGWKRISAKGKAMVEHCLKGEVRTYDMYLKGEVYGYVIENPEGEELDSCWGFYGADYIETEVNSILNSYVSEVA